MADSDYAGIRIWHDQAQETFFRRGGLHSLSMLAGDELLLEQILAGRQACFLHSSGAVINGKGVLFAGHSGVGKSTIRTMLADRGAAGLLCDDRNIVSRPADGFRACGSWLNRYMSDVSAASAPLGAIAFLEQSEENSLVPIEDKREIIRRVLPCLLRTFAGADWWHSALSRVEQVCREVPCYLLRFDMSGEVVDVLAGEL